MLRNPAHIRFDGCPECMARDNAPHATEPAETGVICHYRCTVCGCEWTTSWWGGEV